jgi:hypothetical protein
MDILIETAQLLEKGASIIEERGWCQQTLQEHDGSVCVFGSILAAEGFDIEEAETVAWSGAKSTPLHNEVVTALISEIYPKGAPWQEGEWHTAGLISSKWNDRPGQTAYNVTSTMRRAAERLYERGNT